MSFSSIAALEEGTITRVFRHLVKRVIVGVAALLAVIGAWAEAPRPNIIHILADDMGYGDAGFNGQTRIRTPNIDRLAREGMVFRQHYSGCTVCTPSRACLMTGLHTGRVVMDRNSLDLHMRPEEITVAEVLRGAGYETHFIGKWGLGGAGMADDPHVDSLPWTRGNSTILPGHEVSVPTAQGFDSSYAYLNQAYAHLYYPVHLWRNTTPELIPENQAPVYENRRAYSHDLLEAETLRILRRADGSTPVYTQLSYTLPHRETKIPRNYSPYAHEDWPEVEKAYATMITRLDDTVGRILEVVDTNPALAENTLVIFTSDNGPQSTDGHSPFFFDSNGPLRGSKRDLYEGGVRAPTAMRWRGTIPPGSSTDLISAFWDFLPTCAELAGAETPPGLDGISFAPTLTGEGTQQRHEFLFWAFHENGAGPAEGGGFEPVQRLSVRQGDWKLVVLRDGPPELYNLAADPGETANVADKHLSIRDELHAIARREAARGPHYGAAAKTAP